MLFQETGNLNLKGVDSSGSLQGKRWLQRFPVSHKHNLVWPQNCIPLSVFSHLRQLKGLPFTGLPFSIVFQWLHSAYPLASLHILSFPQPECWRPEMVCCFSADFVVFVHTQDVLGMESKVKQEIHLRSI